MLRRLVATFAPESGDDFLGDAFDVRTFDPGRTLVVGDVELRFAPTSHYVPTFAIRFDSGGASVTYSADTSPDSNVVALATNCDAFVCEATLTTAGEAEIPRGHTSAREAAVMAAEAGAASLYISHYPASADPHELEATARTGFGGAVVVVDDGYRFAVSSRSSPRLGATETGRAT
jgi:ribonuclease BN (tRNA processing enzyme)